jgi:hypothetical protein
LQIWVSGSVELSPSLCFAMATISITIILHHHHHHQGSKQATNQTIH